MAIAASGALGAVGDWTSANYDNTSVRYSPLTQINQGNVKNLDQAWVYHLKPAGFTGREGNERGSGVSEGPHGLGKMALAGLAQRPHYRMRYAGGAAASDPFPALVE